MAEQGEDMLKQWERISKGEAQWVQAQGTGEGRPVAERHLETWRHAEAAEIAEQCCNEQRPQRLLELYWQSDGKGRSLGTQEVNQTIELQVLVSFKT